MQHLGDARSRSRRSAAAFVLHADRGVQYLIAVLGVVLVIGGLGAIKGAQFAVLAAHGRQEEQRGPAPEAVGVWTANVQSFEKAISAVGTVTSGRGVSISAEVAGIVSRIAFSSGATIEKGEVLVELDSSVERAQLAAAMASQDLAQANAERTRALVAVDVAPREELDQVEAALQTATADVAMLRARIEQKVIRAPFRGRLGIRAVDLGQYLDPGTPITVLETTDTMFVDFTLPQQHLGDVSVGTLVRIVVAGATPMHGTLAAVEPAVDPSTRSIRLRALVPDGAAEPRLRAGMFVDVDVVLPGRAEFVTVPATAIVRAPYGDSVFVLEDKDPAAPGLDRTDDGKPVKVARQQFVRTGDRRGDFVAVLEGVIEGQQVVSAGAFKLRHGSPVFVSDLAVTEPNLQPRPENR